MSNAALGRAEMLCESRGFGCWWSAVSVAGRLRMSDGSNAHTAWIAKIASALSTFDRSPSTSLSSNCSKCTAWSIFFSWNTAMRGQRHGVCQLRNGTGQCRRSHGTMRIVGAGILLDRNDRTDPCHNRGRTTQKPPTETVPAVTANSDIQK